MSDASEKFKSRDIRMVQDMLANASSDSHIQGILINRGYSETDADELIRHVHGQLGNVGEASVPDAVENINVGDIALVQNMRANMEADYKIRDVLVQRGHSMDDAIRIMKHASGTAKNDFYKPKRKNDERQYYAPSRSSDGGSKVALGLLIMGIGCAITFFTYSAAANSSNGGTYFIAYGPVIWGGIMVLKGLAGKD